MEVREHHLPVWEGDTHKWAAGTAAAVRLVAAELRLLRRPRSDFDVLLVGYPGQFDLPAAKRAARGRPLVFNPLVSLADTFVTDRGRFRRRSAPAKVLEWIDRRAFRAADLVVADTEAQAEFMAALAGLPPDRFDVCFVGAEERLFHPPWSGDGPALFVGKLIPLHGLETILEAARLVPELELTLVGGGQLEQVLRRRPPNVTWVPWIAYDNLADAYRHARFALGIFGTSDKAARVIPNKVFQALACGTPVITADTPAARELLQPEMSALLVPPGDPQALAEAMRRLDADDELRHKLAAGGQRAYVERASEGVLGRRWRAILERLV